jgi:hypothetical protein
VGTGRLCVDGSRIGLSDRGAEVEHAEHVFDRVDGCLCKTSEEDAAITVLADVYLRSLVERYIFRDKEVAQLLVVDLNVSVHVDSPEIGCLTSTYVALSCQPLLADDLLLERFCKPDMRLGARMPDEDDRLLGVGPSSFSNNRAAARGIMPVLQSVSRHASVMVHLVSNIPMTSLSAWSRGPVVPMVYDFPAPDWP